MGETERMHLPVKFMKKQHADEMMQGRILMRPLKDFEAWESEGQSVKDAPAAGKRRDPMDRQRLTHLLCMYRMQFNPEEKWFEDIPEKMKEFGDTAVVILDPAELFRRLAGWCERCFGQRYQLVVGDVVYDSTYSDRRNENFLVKGAEYSWQKEVRLAAVLSPNLIPVRSKHDECEDPNAEELWYIEIGDLSDIAVEISAEELVTRGFDATGLKPEMIQSLESTRQIAAGMFAREYVFFHDYSMVYPDQEWVTFWQKVFAPEEWIPITEMRELVPGGVKAPILSFWGIDGKRRAIFLPNRATVTLATEDRELLHRFMEQDAGKGHVRYQGVCVISSINLGDPGRKYDSCHSRSYMSEREVFLHGGNYHEIDTLTLSYLKGRNIWGMDIADRKLVFQCELGKNLNMVNADGVMCEIEKIIAITGERVDKLQECEDAYDGFKDL